MSREQSEYQRQSRNVLVVGLGCLGGVIGAMLPTLGMAFRPNISLTDVFLGLPLGFFFGAIVGLLLSKTINKLSDNTPRKTLPDEEQFVGQLCKMCNHRIGSILEGARCPACKSAVHHACRKERLESVEGSCKKCGSTMG